MVSDRVTSVLPEWEGFTHALQARRPDAGTWCEAWTVRDLLLHQTGNAAEVARVLGAHLAGRPVLTRGFEEREAPYAAMSDADLWQAFVARCEHLTEITETAEQELPAEAEIAWTGRTVSPAFFASTSAKSWCCTAGT